MDLREKVVDFVKLEALDQERMDLLEKRRRYAFLCFTKGKRRPTSGLDFQIHPGGKKGGDAALHYV